MGGAGATGSGGGGGKIPSLLAPCEPTEASACSDQGQVLTCELKEGSYKWVHKEACSASDGKECKTSARGAYCGCEPSKVTCEDFGGVQPSLQTCFGTVDCGRLNAFSCDTDCLCSDGSRPVRQFGDHPDWGDYCFYTCLGGVSGEEASVLCFMPEGEACPSSLRECVERATKVTDGNNKPLP